MPLINIEEVNKAVAEIEAKKRAIEEASECGKKALDEKKPKAVSVISFNKSKLRPTIHSDGSYGNSYQIEPDGHKITEPISQYSNRIVDFYKEDLIGIAAIIYKAFEPTAEEWQSFLAKVEVEQ